MALLWLVDVEDDVLDDAEELVEPAGGVAVPPDDGKLVDVEDPADPDDDVDPPEVTVSEDEVDPVPEELVDPDEEDLFDEEELEREEFKDDDNAVYGFVISETMLRPDMTLPLKPEAKLRPTH